MNSPELRRYLQSYESTEMNLTEVNDRRALAILSKMCLNPHIYEGFSKLETGEIQYLAFQIIETITGITSGQTRQSHLKAARDIADFIYYEINVPESEKTVGEEANAEEE